LHDPSDLRITSQEDNKHIAFAPRSFIPAGAVQGANMAFRKPVLERIGGFDETFGPGTNFVCDDIDAVAAALWAGFRDAYDPRPTVYHHHGRRTAQEAQPLFRIYDPGRGAYFVKYIFNKESRYESLRAWISGLKRELRRGNSPSRSIPLFRCIAAPHRRGRFIRPNRASSSNIRKGGLSRCKNASLGHLRSKPFFKVLLRLQIPMRIKRTRHHLAPIMTGQKIVDLIFLVRPPLGFGLSAPTPPL
jgi:GT2 family glycosyltransferase